MTEQTETPKPSMIDVLADFLKNGSDWERFPTSIKGLSILKMPAWKSRPAILAVELLPEGMRKGIIFRDFKSFEDAKRCLDGIEKMSPVFQVIKELNQLTQTKEPMENDREALDLP